MKVIKTRLIVLILCFISACGVYAQNRTIEGRVITEFFETMPGVFLMIQDTVRVGKTDLEGFFQIDIPTSERKIYFGTVGMEPTTIELSDGCNTIELVMMYLATDDFIGLRRAERRRKRRFKKLPKIHEQAFEKKLFESKNPCYNRKFEALYLDEK